MKPKHETKKAFNLRMREYNRKRYLANKPAFMAANAKWRQANPRKAKAISVRKSWRDKGIKHHNGAEFTLDDYDLMFAHQQGKCAICSKHQSELRYALNVDHDHVTGAVRGLLCAGCNVRLAVFEDKEFINKCRRYLGA